MKQLPRPLCGAHRASPPERVFYAGTFSGEA